MAGNIYKLGDQRYLVQVFLGRDNDGRQLRHRKTIRGTKKDAERYLTGYLRDRDLGRYAEPARLTLEAFLTRWLGTAVHDLSPRTLHEYRANLERYVVPALGAVRLDRLAPLQIQEMYTSLSERGLAPGTVQMVHRALSAALREAVAWGMLAENPAKRTRRPRVRPQARRILTEDEAARLMEVFRGMAHPWGTVLELALATGMRPEEYLGLRWEDVDWTGGAVSVHQVLVRLTRRGRGGGPAWLLEPPKTEKSRRTLVVPEECMSRLREHRKQQMERQLQAGPSWEDHGLVFTTGLGTPLNANNLGKRQFRDALAAAGLPGDLTLYTLRHSHCTLLLAGGVAIKLVSERMGHTSVSFTLDVYGHVLPTQQTLAADQFSRMVYQRSGTTEVQWARPTLLRAPTP